MFESINGFLKRLDASNVHNIWVKYFTKSEKEPPDFYKKLPELSNLNFVFEFFPIDPNTLKSEGKDMKTRDELEQLLIDKFSLNRSLTYHEIVICHKAIPFSTLNSQELQYLFDGIFRYFIIYTYQLPAKLISINDNYEFISKCTDLINFFANFTNDLYSDYQVIFTNFLMNFGVNWQDILTLEDTKFSEMLFNILMSLIAHIGKCPASINFISRQLGQIYIMNEKLIEQLLGFYSVLLNTLNYINNNDMFVTTTDNLLIQVLESNSSNDLRFKYGLVYLKFANNNKYKYIPDFFFWCFKTFTNFEKINNNYEYPLEWHLSQLLAASTKDNLYKILENLTPEKMNDQCCSFIFSKMAAENDFTCNYDMSSFLNITDPALLLGVNRLFISNHVGQEVKLCQLISKHDLNNFFPFINYILNVNPHKVISILEEGNLMKDMINKSIKDNDIFKFLVSLISFIDDKSSSMNDFICKSYFIEEKRKVILSSLVKIKDQKTLIHILNSIISISKPEIVTIFPFLDKRHSPEIIEAILNYNTLDCIAQAALFCPEIKNECIILLAHLINDHHIDRDLTAYDFLKKACAEKSVNITQSLCELSFKDCIIINYRGIEVLFHMIKINDKDEIELIKKLNQLCFSAANIYELSRANVVEFICERIIIIQESQEKLTLYVELFEKTCSQIFTMINFYQVINLLKKPDFQCPHVFMDVLKELITDKELQKIPRTFLCCDSIPSGIVGPTIHVPDTFDITTKVYLIKYPEEATPFIAFSESLLIMLKGKVFSVNQEEFKYEIPKCQWLDLKFHISPKQISMEVDGEIVAKVNARTKIKGDLELLCCVNMFINFAPFVISSKDEEIFRYKPNDSDPSITYHCRIVPFVSNVHDILPTTGAANNLLPVLQRLHKAESQLSVENGQKLLRSLFNLLTNMMMLSDALQMVFETINVFELLSSFLCLADSKYFTNMVLVDSLLYMFENLRRESLPYEMISNVWLNFQLVSNFEENMQQIYFSSSILLAMESNQAAFMSFDNLDFLIYRAYVYYNEETEVSKLAWMFVSNLVSKKPNMVNISAVEALISNTDNEYLANQLLDILYRMKTKFHCSAFIHLLKSNNRDFIIDILTHIPDISYEEGIKITQTLKYSQDFYPIILKNYQKNLNYFPVIATYLHYFKSQDSFQLMVENVMMKLNETRNMKYWYFFLFLAVENTFDLKENVDDAVYSFIHLIFENKEIIPDVLDLVFAFSCATGIDTTEFQKRIANISPESVPLHLLRLIFLNVEVAHDEAAHDLALPMHWEVKIALKEAIDEEYAISISKTEIKDQTLLSLIKQKIPSLDINVEETPADLEIIASTINDNLASCSVLVAKIFNTPLNDDTNYENRINKLKERFEFEQLSHARIKTTFMNDLEIGTGPWSTNKQDIKYKISNMISKRGKRVLLAINHSYDDHKDASKFRDTRVIPDIDEAPKRIRYKTIQVFEQNDQNIFNTDVILISCSMKYKGVLSLFHDTIIFEGRNEQKERSKHISIKIKDISFIFNHMIAKLHIGAEIHTTHRRSYLFEFGEGQREKFMALLPFNPPRITNNFDFFKSLQKICGSLYQNKYDGMQLINKLKLTQKWQQHELSTYEYLYYLNLLSGRSFHDTTQYPVYPWIIKDVYGDSINLTSPKTYRDLTKAMGAMNDDQLQREKRNVEMFEGTIEYCLFRTHFSNHAIVINTLIRTEPFTKLHIKLQEGRFDKPDRLFRSIKVAWKTFMAPCDGFNESLPEAFSFPQHLINMNGYDLGLTQDSVVVDDVELPDWAHNFAMHYIEANRIALESDYASENIGTWIDKTFGVYRKDLEHENLYHPFTYPEFEPEDETHREFAAGYIMNIGCCPYQIFSTVHPSRPPFIIKQPNIKISLDKEVENLKSGYLFFSGAFCDVLQGSYDVKSLQIKNGKLIGLSRILKKAAFQNDPSYLSIVDLNSGQELKQVKHDTSLIVCSAVVGQFLLTCGNDCSIHVWDLETFELLSVTSYQSDVISSINGCADIGLIVSINQDSCVVFETLFESKFIRTIKLKKTKSTPILTVFKSGIVAIANMTDLMSFDACGMKIHEKKFKNEILKLDKYYDHDTREFIIVSLRKGTIEIVNATTLETISVLEGSPINQVCPINGTRCVVVASRTGLKTISFLDDVNPIIQ